MLCLRWARPMGRASRISGPFALQRCAFRTNFAPRAEKKPWYYEMSVIFSKEARKERARKLKEEVTRGRFHELNEIKGNGGKLFEADMEVLSLQHAKAVEFPDVEVWGLGSRGGGEGGPTSMPVKLSERLAGKVTLVTVCMRDIARPMVSSWVDAYAKKMPHQDTMQIVQLSFVEGVLYTLIRSWMLKSIKRTVPEAHHEQALIAFTDSEPFRGKLELKNRLVGYAFLVDADLRVRWRGCGYALDHEVKALSTAAASLSNVRIGNKAFERKVKAMTSTV